MNPSKQKQLLELMKTRESYSDWWYFPTEPLVQGFLGTGLFIVGIRPSRSKWGPTHPHRRFFYDLLVRIGVANAHLTDIYKRRGDSGDVMVEFEEDFHDHLSFLRKEIEILCPTRVVALGRAGYLLSQYVPELEHKLKRVRHFSWAIKSGKRAEYELEMRTAIEGA